MTTDHRKTHNCSMDSELFRRTLNSRKVSVPHGHLPCSFIARGHKKTAPENKEEGTHKFTSAAIGQMEMFQMDDLQINESIWVVN